MKIACFTIMFGRWPIEEIFPYAAGIGYEALELMPNHLPDSADKLERLKELCARWHMPICLLSTSTGVYGGKTVAECEMELEKLKPIVKLARELSCTLIRHGGGLPSARVATIDDYKWTTSWMRKAADIAAAEGIRIVEEIHNYSLTETAEQSRMYLEMIGRDNVGMIHDAGNMYIADTDFGERSVEILGDRIFHVHVKDELRVTDPNAPGTFRNPTKHGEEFFQHTLLGEGGADHRPLFKALAKRGYDGYLSCEYHGAHDPISAAKHEYSTVKNLLKEAIEAEGS